MSKSFNFENRVTTVTLLSLGLFIAIRGFYWTLKQNEVLLDSDFYSAMDKVMPIYIWGTMLIIFGASLMLASFFYGHKKESNLFLKLILFGGIGGSSIHFIMSSASLFNAINWITPAQFLIITGLLGFIGVMAGVELYGRKWQIRIKTWVRKR